MQQPPFFAEKTGLKTLKLLDLCCGLVTSTPILRELKRLFQSWRDDLGKESMWSQVSYSQLTSKLHSLEQNGANQERLFHRRPYTSVRYSDISVDSGLRGNYLSPFCVDESASKNQDVSYDIFCDSHLRTHDNILANSVAYCFVSHIPGMSFHKPCKNVVSSSGFWIFASCDWRNSLSRISDYCCALQISFRMLDRLFLFSCFSDVLYRHDLFKVWKVGEIASV